MNMFNSKQKRMVFIAAMTFLVGFLAGVEGCDGPGVEPANDGGVLLSDGGINPKMNPCGTAPGCTLSTCGWDVATGKCYNTFWCESSVTGVTTNAYPVKDASGKTIYVRPASAVCPAGVLGYTYPTGQIMEWGVNVAGSLQPSTGGYICVPSPQDIPIAC